MQGDFQRVSLGKDMGVTLVPIKKVPLVTFQFDGISVQAVNDGTVKVLARRKDLAGTYDNRTLSGLTAGLVPGVWEMAIFAAYRRILYLQFFEDLAAIMHTGAIFVWRVGMKSLLPRKVAPRYGSLSRVAYVRCTGW